MNATQKAQLDAILKSLPPKRKAPDNSADALIRRLAWARVQESTPALWYEQDRIKSDFHRNEALYGHESARQMLLVQVEAAEGTSFSLAELEAMP